MFDLLVRNATIIDATGGARFTGDVAVDLPRGLALDGADRDHPAAADRIRLRTADR